MSRKLYKILGEFKVYIFMLKVLLYLLIIFGKTRIDTLHEKNGSRKIPLGKIPPENYHQENSHLEYSHPFH